MNTKSECLTHCFLYFSFIVINNYKFINLKIEENFRLDVLLIIKECFINTKILDILILSTYAVHQSVRIFVEIINFYHDPLDE